MKKVKTVSFEKVFEEITWVIECPYCGCSNEYHDDPRDYVYAEDRDEECKSCHKVYLLKLEE